MSPRLLLGLALAVALALLAALLLLDAEPAPGGDAAPVRAPADAAADGARPLPGSAAAPTAAAERPDAAPTPLRAGDPDAARLTGRVVSRAGQPVRDARVLGLVLPAHVFAGPPTLSGQSARTDVEGRFELVDPPTDVKLAVEVDAPGYAAARKQGFRVSAGEARDVGTITLDAGLRLTGVVRDELGEPVAGALLRVIDVERRTAGDEPGELLGETESDAEGRYSVPHLARRQYEITASKPGHAETAAQITFVLGQEVDEWVQDFVLERADTALAGHVLDPDEQPVAGAELHLSRRPGGGGNSYFRTRTTSAEDGSFRFDAVPAGRYDLHLEAPGWYLPGRRKLEAGREDHEVRVQPAIRVHGELTTEGPPLPARFSVRVRPDASTGAGMLPGSDYEQHFDTPDAPGRFTLDGLKPGTYSFEVQAPGFALSRGTQVVLGTSQTEAHVRIPLRAGGGLRGRLVPADGAARVELREGDWDPGLSIELAFPTPALPGLTTPVGADGAFELEHVPAGVYVLSAVPEAGPATHVREVQVAEGQITDVGRVFLTRAGSVGGQVFDERGQPAAGARLTLAGDGHSQQIHADDEGFYLFEGVPAGVAEVLASPPGLWEALRLEARAQVRVDPDARTRLDLQLAPRPRDG